MAKELHSPRAKLVLVVMAIALAAVIWMLASKQAEPGVASYFPLEVGRTWTYETKQLGTISAAVEPVQGTRLGTMEQRIVGLSKLSSGDLEIYELRQRLRLRGASAASEEVSESVLHVSGSTDAILLHDIEVDGAGSLPAPMPILADPPETGPRTIDMGTLRVSLSVKSHEVEAVEVPAGSFPDALKRHVEGPVSGAIDGIPLSSGTLKETTWFVRNVGIVKLTRELEYVLEGPDGSGVGVEETSERALVSYTRGESD